MDQLDKVDITVQSACAVSRFMDKMELYGCTTTSLTSSVFGKTEKVVINFLGNLSCKRSSSKEPSPDPVPPAIEWHSWNPYNNNNFDSQIADTSKLSAPSASRSIMSKIPSSRRAAWAYP